MLRTAAVLGGRRAGRLTGPPTSVRALATESPPPQSTPNQSLATQSPLPQLTPNQAWLRSLLNEVSSSSAKDLDKVRERLVSIDSRLSSAMVKNRDTIDKSIREVNTASWRILVVFGSFALIAFHLVRESGRPM